MTFLVASVEARASERAPRLLLWAVALVAACLSMYLSWHRAIDLLAPWRTHSGPLVDFRDTVVLPGRFLAAGGNPYDPSTYLPANPQAQEFDPYSPSWLLPALLLSWLPYKIFAALYVLVVTGTQLWMAAALSRIAWPRAAALLTPLMFAWQQGWAFTRARQPSELVIAGVLLALLYADDRSRRGRWLASFGVTAAMCKPQYGVVLCLLLLGIGRLRPMLEGALLTILTSLIPLAMCLRASGGVLGFYQALLRDLHHASSDQSMTGLGTNNSRIDLVAMVSRLTNYEVSTLGTLGILAAMVIVAVAAARRSRDAVLFCCVAVPTILLCIVHSDYDLAAMLIPMGYSGAHLRLNLPDNSPGKLISFIMLLASAIPILHVHKVSILLFNWSFLVRETFDVGCVLVSLLCALWLSLSSNSQSSLRQEIGFDREFN